MKTLQELENMPGTPAHEIRHRGLCEAHLGDQPVTITRALGEYVVHDDQGRQLGRGDTPGAAMMAASFGLPHVSLDDDDEEEARSRCHSS
jgi:hypothetical protein